MRFFNTAILFFSILLLGLVSCRESKEVSFWDLIDSNTVLVYESDRPVLVKDRLIDSVLRLSSSKEYVAGFQSINKNSYELIYVVKTS